MKLIICLEKNKGMMFFGKRHSQDRELRKKLIEMTDGHKLWMSTYSAKQFAEYTFTTRMCEAGVNVKVIQDALGHKDISTTLNIYTDVTKELRKSEFEGLELFFQKEYNKVSTL